MAWHLTNKHKIISMKSSVLITLFIISTLLISCSGKNDKREAAKEYLKNQTIYYQEPKTETAHESTDSSFVKVLTDKTFDKAVAKGVSLIDFWAVWCKPCRMQAPIIEEIAVEQKGKVSVYKLDVDENYNVPNRFQIASIPTLMIFKDGKMVEKLVGLHDKQTLTNILKKYL